MQNPTAKKLFTLAAVLLAVWAGLRYALPLVLPFLLGLGIALAAEPMVRFCIRRFRLPRIAGTALSVTVAIIMVLTLMTLLFSALIRELGRLAGVLPEMTDAARQGLISLEDFLLRLARSAPDGLQGLLTRWVLSIFHDTSRWSDAMVEHLPGIATSILGRIPNSALMLFTMVISSYMISARLPSLRKMLTQRIPKSWKERVIPPVKKLRHCLGRWVAAQARLCGVSFSIMCVGLLLLRIPHAPLWALIIALVDALPVLGSGTVLVPWALICFLQGSDTRAIGLLAVYILVTTSRSVLEPKMLGKQLGLDPLVTLVALYAGFRIWGVLGMIFAPMLAVVSTELVKSQQ